MALSQQHIDLKAPHQMRIIEGELNNIIDQAKEDPMLTTIYWFV